jgi:hypothetical protein
MAWKIHINPVGSSKWLALRRQREFARSWISDVAPLRKKRKLGVLQIRRIHCRLLVQKQTSPGYFRMSLSDLGCVKTRKTEKRRE